MQSRKNQEKNDASFLLDGFNFAVYITNTNLCINVIFQDMQNTCKYLSRGLILGTKVAKF